MMGYHHDGGDVTSLFATACLGQHFRPGGRGYARAVRGCEQGTEPCGLLGAALVPTL
jgi:hypothetical protein